MSGRKKRGRNFSPKEEQILMKLVEEFREVIENKKSDAATWRKKHWAWTKIANRFAAASGTARECRALRDKYDNMKRQSKLKLAAEKRESDVNSVSNHLPAMHWDSATSISNTLDSDNVKYERNALASDSEQEIYDIVKTEDNTGVQSEWDILNPKELEQPSAKRMCVCVKQKLTLEETKIELILSQKRFQDDQNRRAEEKHQGEQRRAEEKHQEEMHTIRLQNELLKLQLLKQQKEIND